jgi:nucleoid DNA-binding protein
VDVTAFIKELLFGHDCVIVPGFGGFIGNYTPARIDKSTGTFYPPVKQISFNRNLNNNDGLLLGRISASAEINYVDARSIVEEFVAGVRKKLERGEKVIFDHIGSFVNNHEGNVQFEPDRSANYHLDSYGLEPFKCLPLEGYDVRKRINQHIERDPVKQLLVRKIIWRAAVIVPLLALLVAVPLKTNLFRGKVESTTMNPLLTAEFENNKNAVDEVNNSIVESSKLNDSTTAITEKTTEPEVIIPAVTESNSYVLITGSFKSKENANSQLNALIADGFSPEIVTTESGFYRVCAIACNDLKTANFKKDSIAKKFPGSWVSKKK